MSHGYLPYHRKTQYPLKPTEEHKPRFECKPAYIAATLVGIGFVAWTAYSIMYGSAQESALKSSALEKSVNSQKEEWIRTKIK